VSVTEAGDRLAVVLPGDEPGTLVARTFAAWGAWPPSLSPPVTACTGCLARDFTVSPARPAAQPGCSLAAFDVIPQGDDYPLFALALHPAIPAGEPPVPLPEAVVDTPQLARGAAGHLLGYTRVGPDEQPRALAYVPWGAAAAEPLGDVACGWASAPLLAIPGGFLMAAQSSFGEGPDACADTAVPSILRIDEATRQITRTALPSLTEPGWDYFLLLAGSEEGAWAVTQADASQGYDAVGPIQVTRLLPSGAPVGAFHAITAPDGDRLWGAVALGSRLIVASVGYATGGTALRLTMVREDGEVRTVYEDVDPAYASPWLAVVVAPEGRQLVFGAPGRLVRLACAGGY
jgi:hypothetical protein